MKRYLSILKVCVIAAAGAVICAGCNSQKNVRFAVIADIQYADKESEGKRNYRAAIENLGRCVEELNKSDVEFVIQLGDIIDGGQTAKKDLAKVLEVLGGLKVKVYHTAGNHDFDGIGRKTAGKMMGVERPYYWFRKSGWRLVVLDTMDVAVDGGWEQTSEHRREGERMLAELSQAGAPNAEKWNGGIGQKQKAWLVKVLAEAQKAGEKVIVFGHHPIKPEGQVHNLWNNEEIAAVLEANDCVKAYLCGHKHDGGYAKVNGIDYVTVQGMVEAGQENAWAIVTLGPDRIEIDGTGKVPDRVME